jgi:hypothetical protein
VQQIRLLAGVNSLVNRFHPEEVTMSSGSNDASNLLQECETVAENSLYNAQAHLFLADSKEKQALLLLVVPSFVAGICGLLTAVGLPQWLGAVSAAGGLVATVAGVLGIDKQPTLHRNAASQWTALRHEARSLYQTMFKELPQDQFLAEVRRIDDRYVALCQALPPTNRKSFETARKQIKTGTHELDFKQKGE